MTDTEESLQEQLDADPRQHHLRLILADHLDEIGDPRGEGYRALGRLGLYPHITPEPARRYNGTGAPGFHGGGGDCFVSYKQFLAIPKRDRPQVLSVDRQFGLVEVKNLAHCRLPADWWYECWGGDILLSWAIADTRRGVEDLVILTAFNHLPDWRRRELATGNPPNLKPCPHCTGGVFATVDMPSGRPVEIACNTCKGEGKLPCL